MVRTVYIKLQATEKMSHVEIISQSANLSDFQMDDARNSSQECFFSSTSENKNFTGAK